MNRMHTGISRPWPESGGAAAAASSSSSAEHDAHDAPAASTTEVSVYLDSLFPLVSIMVIDQVDSLYADKELMAAIRADSAAFGVWLRLQYGAAMFLLHQCKTMGAALTQAMHKHVSSDAASDLDSDVDSESESEPAVDRSPASQVASHLLRQAGTHPAVEAYRQQNHSHRMEYLVQILTRHADPGAPNGADAPPPDLSKLTVAGKRALQKASVRLLCILESVFPTVIGPLLTMINSQEIASSTALVILQIAERLRRPLSNGFVGDAVIRMLWQSTAEELNRIARPFYLERADRNGMRSEVRLYQQRLDTLLACGALGDELQWTPGTSKVSPLSGRVFHKWIEAAKGLSVDAVLRGVLQRLPAENPAVYLPPLQFMRECLNGQRVELQQVYPTLSTMDGFRARALRSLYLLRWGTAKPVSYRTASDQTLHWNHPLNKLLYYQGRTPSLQPQRLSPVTVRVPALGRGEFVAHCAYAHVPKLSNEACLWYGQDYTELVAVVRRTPSAQLPSAEPLLYLVRTPAKLPAGVFLETCTYMAEHGRAYLSFQDEARFLCILKMLLDEAFAACKGERRGGRVIDHVLNQICKATSTWLRVLVQDAHHSLAMYFKQAIWSPVLADEGKRGGLSLNDSPYVNGVDGWGIHPSVESSDSVKQYAKWTLATLLAGVFPKGRPAVDGRAPVMPAGVIASMLNAGGYAAMQSAKGTYSTARLTDDAWAMEKQLMELYGAYVRLMEPLTLLNANVGADACKIIGVLELTLHPYQFEAHPDYAQVNYGLQNATAWTAPMHRYRYTPTYTGTSPQNVRVVDPFAAPPRPSARKGRRASCAPATGGSLEQKEVEAQPLPQGGVPWMDPPLTTSLAKLEAQLRRKDKGSSRPALGSVDLETEVQKLTVGFTPDEVRYALLRHCQLGGSAAITLALARVSNRNVVQWSAMVDRSGGAAVDSASAEWARAALPLPSWTDCVPVGQATMRPSTLQVMRRVGPKRYGRASLATRVVWHALYSAAPMADLLEQCVGVGSLAYRGPGPTAEWLGAVQAQLQPMYDFLLRDARSLWQVTGHLLAECGAVQQDRWPEWAVLLLLATGMAAAKGRFASVRFMECILSGTPKGDAVAESFRGGCLRGAARATAESFLSPAAVAGGEEHVLAEAAHMTFSDWMRNVPTYCHGQPCGNVEFCELVLAMFQMRVGTLSSVLRDLHEMRTLASVDKEDGDADLLHCTLPVLYRALHARLCVLLVTGDAVSEGPSSD